MVFKWFNYLKIFLYICAFFSRVQTHRQCIFFVTQHCFVNLREFSKNLIFAQTLKWKAILLQTCTKWLRTVQLNDPDKNENMNFSEALSSACLIAITISVGNNIPNTSVFIAEELRLALGCRMDNIKQDILPKAHSPYSQKDFITVKLCLVSLLMGFRRLTCFKLIWHLKATPA